MENVGEAGDFDESLDGWAGVEDFECVTIVESPMPRLADLTRPAR